MAAGKNKTKRPKREAVAEYWGKAFYCEPWRCMACGKRGTPEDPNSIQRAHINSDRGGYTTFVANIHLLCPRCHSTSEYLEGVAYWRWLKAMRTGRGFDYDQQKVEEILKDYDYRFKNSE